MAVLHLICCVRNERLTDVDVVMTAQCCGWGQMPVEQSVQQVLDALRDYRDYPRLAEVRVVGDDTVLAEPNLLEQPKLYQNTEWFTVAPNEIQRG